ncbi:hypothetical protein MTO96_033008 [Rhipicephalus appendiculatus]
MDSALPSFPISYCFVGAQISFTGDCEVVDAKTGAHYTFGELFNASRRVAAGLKAIGLRNEDVVAVHCANRPEFVFALCGVFLAGGCAFLVKTNITEELENLDTPKSKVDGLIVDEMRIQQRLLYHKQRDAFVDDVDMWPELEQLAPKSGEYLANSLLCFLLCDLGARFKIPAGYFFTKGCTGQQLALAISDVLKKTAEAGFDVVPPCDG